jgi:hypothetical protein
MLIYQYCIIDLRIKGDDTIKHGDDTNNIFEEIEALANKGISIDYNIIDQNINGEHERYPDMKTYTVYVREVWSCGEPIYDESFDHLEDALKKGIKVAKEYLRKNKKVKC